MQRSWHLRSKLNAIVCAMSVAAAASVKEGETREMTFGGQALYGYLIIALESGVEKRADEIRAEEVEKRIQHQKLMVTERATSAEKDSLRGQIAAVEAEKRAPAESKGVADRPAHLRSNYEVPVQKLAQVNTAQMVRPPPGARPIWRPEEDFLGRKPPLQERPGARPIWPPEEDFLGRKPSLQERPGARPEQDSRQSPGPRSKAAAEKAAAEKDAAEKAAAEKAAAEGLWSQRRLPEFGLGALGVSLVVVVGLWLLRRAYQKASAPVQELLRKALVNPEEVGRLVESNATTPQDVDVTVFAPPVVPPCEEVIVQVIFHTPDRDVEALTRAQKVEPAGQALASVPLTIQVRQNDNIKVTVECVNATIPEPVQSTVWNGRLVYLYFTMQMPNAEMIVRPKLRVFVNGVPAGNLVFKILVQQNPPDSPRSPANETAWAFRKAFLSYASEDRVQVLRTAQILRLLKIDFFQDVLNLSPGERWERRLYAEIDNCDLFLLFWSHHAQQSEWVIREAEYALQRAKAAPGDGVPEISPCLLEEPPPLPPVSLKDIHFNDPIRYIILAEESRRR